ncbi:MAG: PfkB family carbohydrate kinase, partial [Bacilli bacterium]
WDDCFYKVDIPKINVLNTVGSGDALLGGIALGLKNQLPLEELLKLASACGMNNAMHLETGKVNLKQVNELIPLITIKLIEGVE